MFTSALISKRFIETEKAKIPLPLLWCAANHLCLNLEGMTAARRFLFVGFCDFATIDCMSEWESKCMFIDIKLFFNTKTL